MIRVYLDWNVVSNLKRPEFKELRDFIIKHKEKLLFPYTPAHFNDLMKSYKPDNELFFEDLNTLGLLSEKYLLRWEGDNTKFLLGTPRAYFEGVKDQDVFLSMDVEKMLKELDEIHEEIGGDKIGDSIKLLFEQLEIPMSFHPENKVFVNEMFPSLKRGSSMWDLMKDIGLFWEKVLQDRDYYKDIRQLMRDQGMVLNSSIAGNWSFDEVIKNIDEFLFSIGVEVGYFKYVESLLTQDKGNIYQYYTTAYLLLDLIGYKIDKLPKPTDNMRNIINDGDHSFYGAYCDFFVASDRKLRIKSKVLYNELNVSTIIIEPKELIGELKRAIYNFPAKEHIVEEVLSFYNTENLIESIPLLDNGQAKIDVFKLPKLYFNFFNYMVCENYLEEGIVFTFKKVFKNLSRGIYYAEGERVIESITEFFGYSNKDERDFKKKQLVYGSEYIIFEWSFKNVVIRLTRDEETKRPILNYIFNRKR